MINIKGLQIPEECISNSIIPTEYQPWYEYMEGFLKSSIFNPPMLYKDMKFGLHILTASAGLEFWDILNANDLHSEWYLHFNLETNKKMIDIAKEIGIDYIMIRTRYPDNNYIPNAEETLHQIMQYAKSKGLGIYLLFNPIGPEHIHVPYGDSTTLIQKFNDFIDEYVYTYKPLYYQLYENSQILKTTGINTYSLIPQMYNKVKNSSPSTLYVEAEGAWTRTQVNTFKYFCDSPYNDVMGIPFHDLYYNSYLLNLKEMIIYAKGKGRDLICPDAWLSDYHADKPWELMTNGGWREPLDSNYIQKIVNLAQTAGFKSISPFYGNLFVSYNPNFFYVLGNVNSDIWVNCLNNNSRTSLIQSYTEIINKVRRISNSYNSIGILTAFIIAGLLTIN